MEVFGIAFPKSRKNHTCDLCCGVIKKDETYKRWAYADGGIASSLKVHIRCDNILNTYLDGDAEFDMWGVRDYINEMCDDNSLCDAKTPLYEKALLIDKMNRRKV